MYGASHRAPTDAEYTEYAKAISTIHKPQTHEEKQRNRRHTSSRQIHREHTKQQIYTESTQVADTRRAHR